MSNFSYQKILIVRLSSLGDVLLTTPLIRSLKKDNSKTEIHFLVREEYKDALVNNKNISKLIIFNRTDSAAKIKSELSQSKYELIIDLQNNFRSRNLIFGLNCPVVRFKKLSLQKFLLVNLKLNLLKNSPQIPERYAATLNNLKLDDEGLELISDRKASLSLTINQKLIGFCPGSRHFTKMWPKEYYVELGRKLIADGFGIVLFGGKSDKQICAEISSSLNGCLNLCNENDLLQTAADMKMCKAVVCNDSGLMHTASAVQVPLAAIFGSTVKEFGFVPYKCKNLILENKSLTCRPCSHIGRSSCPKKHFKCMKELTPQLVYNSLISFLNK
ncbi:MAG: lipopolysaccharide heptosyltransferase II [Ignavibacteriaceae bacterium]|nr:lipopolysaccharide heptosyltransferase II [Ignavibacteriaceae bacterium]